MPRGRRTAAMSEVCVCGQADRRCHACRMGGVDSRPALLRGLHGDLPHPWQVEEGVVADFHPHRLGRRAGGGSLVERHVRGQEALQGAA